MNTEKLTYCPRCLEKTAELVIDWESWELVCNICGLHCQPNVRVLLNFLGDKGLLGDVENLLDYAIFPEEGDEEEASDE